MTVPHTVDGMYTHTHTPRAPSLILSLALVLRTPCSDSLFLVWGERCRVLRGREKGRGGAERKYSLSQARRIIKQTLDLFWQLSYVRYRGSTFLSEQSFALHPSERVFSHEYKVITLFRSCIFLFFPLVFLPNVLASLSLGVFLVLVLVVMLFI